MKLKILLKEDLIIEKVAPEGVMEGDSKKGDVYIDVTRTPELDSEGYAREIMRRIQNTTYLGMPQPLNMCISQLDM